MHESAYRLIIASFAADPRLDWQRSLVLLREMQRRGLRPDVPTLTAVISACERARKFDVALLLMEEMRREGYDFYDVPVVDRLFKQAVRVLSR